jgi:hypothetical protein
LASPLAVIRLTVVAVNIIMAGSVEVEVFSEEG